MQTHSVKISNSKSTDPSEKKQRNTNALQFADNRPQAAIQRKLQDAADNGPQARNIAQFQAMADNHGLAQNFPIQKKENNTGLPDNLKSGIENLSGYSMDDVKVHYNSDKPAQLQAHAYAQGTDIHIASGQEKHLPHEAWHVVQQKQGRVKPTLQMKGKVNINDDAGLEKEADVMGTRAAQLSSIDRKAFKNEVNHSSLALSNRPIQRYEIKVGEMTLATLDQVKKMMASYENIGWDDRWTSQIQFFLAKNKSFHSPQQLESILEINTKHNLLALIEKSPEIKWDDKWDEAVEMIARHPIYTFQSISELIQLLDRLTLELQEGQENESLNVPPRKSIRTTWWVGMTTPNADEIIKNGFKMRSGDPISVASENNMARNGKGIYLSASEQTATAFGAVAADDGPTSVFKIELNVSAFTGIEHQMDGKGTTHLVRQGFILGSTTGQQDTNARNQLRIRLIKKHLEANASGVDYVFGKTEGKGTDELVLLSENIGAAIAGQFSEKNRKKLS